MSPARIDRIIIRFAYQIYENTRGSDQLVIFGINDRGHKLAVRLASALTDVCQTEISASPICVEDASDNSAEPLPFVEGKKVVIIDDVMYSGKTMYYALRKITKSESPDEITLAALIDRGHRRYPLNLQYVGLYCPTKLQEHVRCSFSEQGNPDGVWLLSSSGTPS